MVSAMGALRKGRRGRRLAGLKYVYMVLGALMFGSYYFTSPDGSISSPEGTPTQFSTGRHLLGDNITSPTPAPTPKKPIELMKMDYFSIEAKKNGAILFHIWGILVMFYGIALLCDNYFEPALEKICEVWNLEEDVAGATFMAAGGSAPELATSLLGVFVTKDDVGIGTIVGSAVFNVLFVIAVCAILAPNLDLTWWPLARDCTYYCFSILVLTFCVLDQEVTYVEAIVLLLLYGVYVLIMAYNQKLHKWVDYKIHHHDLGNRPKVCRLMAHYTSSNAFEFFIYCVIIMNLVITAGFPSEAPIPDMINNVCAVIYILEWLFKTFGLGFVGYWLDAMNAFDGVLVMLIIVEFILADVDQIAGSVRTARLFRFFRVVRIIRMIRLARALTTEKSDASTQTTPRLWGGTSTPGDQYVVPDAGNASAASAATVNVASPGVGGAKVVPDQGESAPATDEKAQEGGKDGENDGGDEEDEEDEGPFDPFEQPDDNLGKFIWFTNLPIALLIWLVVPDCQRENREKWYPITFINCILTIAVLAYVMVWMATIFGEVADIPPPVMGLTFLAAGTSIPDALSSLAVARRGFGDMAVSSSVGSNIFDILIGLPVPWFLKTACVSPGEVVVIASDGIAIMIITLFIMVALVIVTIRLYRWKLVKKLGYVYLFLYVLFVVESLMLEYNVLF